MSKKFATKLEVLCGWFPLLKRIDCIEKALCELKGAEDADTFSTQAPAPADGTDSAGNNYEAGDTILTLANGDTLCIGKANLETATADGTDALGNAYETGDVLIDLPGVGLICISKLTQNVYDGSAVTDPTTAPGFTGEGYEGVTDSNPNTTSGVIWYLNGTPISCKPGSTIQLTLADLGLSDGDEVTEAIIQAYMTANFPWLAEGTIVDVAGDDGEDNYTYTNDIDGQWEESQNPGGGEDCCIESVALQASDAPPTVSQIEAALTRASGTVVEGDKACVPIPGAPADCVRIYEIIKGAPVLIHQPPFLAEIAEDYVATGITSSPWRALSAGDDYVPTVTTTLPADPCNDRLVEARYIVDHADDKHTQQFSQLRTAASATISGGTQLTADGYAGWGHNIWSSPQAPSDTPASGNAGDIFGQNDYEPKMQVEHLFFVPKGSVLSIEVENKCLNGIVGVSQALGAARLTLKAVDRA